MKKVIGNIILLLILTIPVFAQVAVTGLSITEAKITGHVLTGHYTYGPGNPNPEKDSQYRWYRAKDISGAEAVPITGAIDITYLIQSADVDYYIGFEVIPQDDQGNVGVADTVYFGPIKNEAPVAIIDSIIGAWYLNQKITAYVSYTDAEGDKEGTSLYQWYRSNSRFGTYIPIPAATDLSYKLTLADTNQFLFFEVIPVALSGTSPGAAVHSDTFQVQNAAPKAIVSSISGIRQIKRTLSVNVVYSDLENDPQGISEYQWFRGTSKTGSYSPIAGADTLIYTLTLSDKDQFLFFRVIPVATSGTSPGIAAYSDTIQVENTAPVITIDSITGTPKINNTIHAYVTYTDLENDPNVSQYQWYSSASRTGSYTAIPGANGLNLLITSNEKDKYIYFEARAVASSGVFLGNTDYSDTIQVINTAPYAIVNIISGNPQVGQTITASYTYHDLENDAQGASVLQWYRGETKTGEYTAVSGENDLDYLVTLSDKGHYLYFEVIPVAVSGVSLGKAVRSDTLQYVNTAPIAQNIYITGTTSYNDTLSGNYTFHDADGDGEGTSTFRWLISSTRSGGYSPVSGATQLTYLIKLADVNKYIYFEVVPAASEGQLQGLPYASDTVFIGNEAPVVSNISINGTFQLGKILVGTYTYSDLEGDEEGTSVYKWYRANTVTGLGKSIIPGAISRSYIVQSADMDKYLSFEVTPIAKTGTVNGNLVASAFMGPVSNAAPTAQNIQITGQQLVCKTITASYDYYDLEGDPEGATVFQWYRASSREGIKDTISGAVDTFYTLTLADQGKYIFFEITARATSGNIYGSPKMSTPFGVIINLLPTVTISGGKSICAGQTTPLNFLFAGSPPFNLQYTDGTNNYSLSSSSYVKSVPVSNAGNYKGIQLTDNLNCPVTDLPSNTTVTVNPLPTVEINGLKEAYSVNASAVQLVGNPSGGTFSGNGVIPSTNKFYPNIAGADTVAHPIIYTYVSPTNGCVNSDTVFVRVYDVDALIVGLRSSYMYCNFDKPLTITGINRNDSIGTFTITGNIGLTDNGDNTAILSPALLATGQYTISYTYFDNVNQTITQTITIENIDEPVIFGISDGSFCRNVASFGISSYPVGTFSGAGIVNGSGTYFAPSLANLGRNPIYFNYSTSYGCKYTDSVVLNILPLPRPQFEVLDNCLNGDSTKFLNYSQPLDSIVSWDWNFGDNFAPGDKNKSDKFEPKHLYPSTGNRVVQLIAQNSVGCSDTIIKTIHLGDIPMANFYWNHECYAKGQNIQFTNTSSSINKISKYKWTVNDTTVTPFIYTTSNILHVFPKVGNYKIKLLINTENNCKDSIEKTITMLPVHILKDTVYKNNFEYGSIPWAPKSNSQAVWQLGTPNGSQIKTAYSGYYAYFTKFINPRIDNQVEILSPCFDFSDIQRPFIEMRINYDAAVNSEGAVLQYSNDDTLSWKNIGGLSTGVNWYTNNAIDGSPGGQKTGWSGTSKGWLSARHNLDSIQNIKNIKFRIVYAEKANAQIKDGFAFDDVYIGQRSKSVLFEHFTNSASANYNTANTELYNVLDVAGIDAISIQYHTSFPGIDSLNSYNQSDPGARVLFYGIGNVPACILDGGIETNYIYNFTTQKPTLEDVNIRSLKDPYFNIQITSDHIVPRITGSIKVTALKDISNYKITLYIAIVEDIVVQSGQNQIVLRNVLKKFLPSAIGQALKENWTKGNTVETSIDWKYTKVYNPKSIKIVAFIQDDQTKEVYQVVSVNTDPMTSIRPVFADKRSIKLYPNPATYNTIIEFNNALPDNCQLLLLDLNGRLLKTFPLFRNTSLFNLDVSGLSSGMYIVQIRKANEIITSQKLLINR